MQNHNQNHNPSKDSTTTNPKSPPSSPQHPHPPPSGGRGGSGASTDGGQIKIKSPLQVLAELASSESPESYDDGDGGVGLTGGVSSVALAAGGSMVMVQEGAGDGEGRGKKRKGSDLKDSPTGAPPCSLCYKEFLSWKGAFGHMRKHPERDYRGFYKPPVFSTPTISSATESLAGVDRGDGGGNSNGRGKSGEDRLSLPIRRVVFDLNRPVEGAGPSNAAVRNEAPVPPLAEEKIVDEGKKLIFDLNELPTDKEE